MNMEECSLFEECSAQLCPLSKDLQYHLWYPVEEVCRSRRFSSLNWLKIQKKIAKLKLIGDIGYFTVDMLKLIDRVSKGINGANPNKSGSEQRWIENRQNTKKRINLLQPQYR